VSIVIGMKGGPWSLVLVGAALAAASAAEACASPSRPVPAAVVAPPDVAPAATPDAAAAPARPDLAAVLCHDRSPCSVRRVRPAGRGAHGEALAVVSLDLGVGAGPSQGDDDAGAAVEDDAGNDLTETAAEDTTSARFGGPCHAYEYWLTTDAPGAAPQLLVEACNDGYGASGVGIDVVTVRDNGLTRTQGGGSSWRWSYTNEISLSPLRVLSSMHTGRWSVSTNHEEDSWDWRAFAGAASWYSPPCNARGEPPDEPVEGDAYASLLVPRLELPAAYRAGGWRDASLGACAVDLDGTGDRGFVAFGPKGDRADASVRAVLSDQDELFVEVRDAHPSGATARWVADDHLEIWLATTMGAFGDFCVAKGEAPRQWGVRVADGKVFAGYGAPAAGDLKVERAARDATLVRFRIGLPKGFRGITVAYSDGDGAKQRRIFATSTPKRGVPETVGLTFEPKPERALCEVVGGRLEPRVTFPVKADAGFADQDP